MREDTYNVWRESSSAYGAFFGLVAKEVGMEKALKMHAAVGGPSGDQAGKALKEELGGKKLTTKALGKFMSSMMAGYGMEPEMKEGPKSVTLRIPRCPMYDGYKAAGLDHKTIEKMCSGMAQAEYDAMSKYYPELQGKVKFRESPEGACVEEFTMK